MADDATLMWYQPLVSRFYSYPDWFERACEAILFDVDPDGTVEIQKVRESEGDECAANTWLEFDICGIVGQIANHLPPRAIKHKSQEETIVSKLPGTGDSVIISKLSRLNEMPMHEQRSPEWYAERHSMISASSAWKALSSDAMRKSIIRDKSQPIASAIAQGSGGGRLTNINSPLHWGHKYEPIATALYSLWLNVKVAEYGCIRHSQYPFLGASPDGIVSTPGPLLGRMLEIKNVVNRELTGIPKRDYWIQMQMQMEVCDLPICDFLECQFLEYDDWSKADSDGTFSKSADGKPKGAFLMLWCPGTLTYRYFYPPLTITTLDQYVEWENKIRLQNTGLEWVQRIRWRLENYSLVTVPRNEAWFASIKDDFAAVWKEVEASRRHNDTE